MVYDNLMSMNTKSYTLPSNLILRPALKTFIKKQIATGQFRSENEIINVAVECLRVGRESLIKQRSIPRSIWLKAEEEALAKVWDNSTDAIYDTDWGKVTKELYASIDRSFLEKEN